MGHFVYKYIVDGEIVYIGKNNTNLINRINQHKAEEKFKPYLKKSKIYYFEVEDGYMSEALETLLIKKYRPILNVAKMEVSKCNLHFEEPTWTDFTYMLVASKKLAPKKGIARSDKDKKRNEQVKEFFSWVFKFAEVGQESFSIQIDEKCLNKTFLPSMSWVTPLRWHGINPKSFKMFYDETSKTLNASWDNEEYIGNNMKLIDVLLWNSRYGFEEKSLEGEEALAFEYEVG